MISIKDIAKECNVSVATVSKALNDHDDISAATKDKVRKAAQKLGYTTNVAARALKTHKTYNLGILFADDRAGLSHEYFSMILESFQREAERHGYDITFINHAIAGKKTTYLRHVEYRNLDGVAIMTADFNDPEIIELAASKHPVIVVDYVLDNCAAVLSDNSKGLEEIVKYAYSMGHRKIEQILNLKDRPTLIIFPDDYSYIGGMEVINSRGLSIPNDISAIGYDGINMAKIMNLTTYEQNTKELGQLAARKLIQMINEPHLPPERVIVSGKMFKGSTVKKI